VLSPRLALARREFACLNQTLVRSAESYFRAARATGPVAIAFAILAVVEVSYFPGRDSSLHVSALRAKALALAELTASSIAPALEFEDEAVLGEFLASVARDHEVKWVAACSQAGKVLAVAGTEKSQAGCDAAPATRVSVTGDELRVTTPVAAKTHPGKLSIAFRTAGIAQAHRQAKDVALALAAGILLLGLGVCWWIARSLIRLQALLDANRAARHSAEAASRAKSAFLANMSHEIRTPMNGVLGVTELLERSALDERQREHVTTIARSGELLLAIINDILDFSKIEAGKLELAQAKVEPRSLVDEVRRAVGAVASSRNLELTSTVADDVPRTVVADGVRLRQVLLNLLSNAIKFTDRGQVRLVVRKDERAPDHLRFEVIDTGIGIAEVNHERLFDAFSQVDEASTRRHGGTGLGLAICKRLVELMRGTLGVESKPGAGSTFWFSVPLPATAERELEPAPGVAPPLPVATEGPRLLAVDDNEINRAVIEHLAESLGYRLEVAESGTEAIARVTGGEQYALVLMDCQMPEVDGYMATGRIRAWEASSGAPRLPIIAVTAHALDGERDKVLAAGMDDFLPKPVRLEALRRMVDKWLRAAPAGRTRPAEGPSAQSVRPQNI
jgi:signal transduction histidine kinase/FixJ family two-component response regulator